MKSYRTAERLIAWIKGNRSFLWIVAVPVAIAGIYYIFIASDRYVSESRLTVKRTGDMSAGIINLGPIALGSGADREDALYLKEYIHSFDMLDFLDRQFSLRKMYQDSRIDFITRLSSGASNEDFLKYYKKRVEVSYDEPSSVLTIRVQAFKPELAKKINEAIIGQSERFINAISHKIAAEQMLFVEQDLARTKDRLQSAKNRVLGFQNVHHVIDPVEQAKSMAGFVTQMETTLASNEAELRTLLTYLNEDSYQVVALKNKIESLREQIVKEKERLTGKGDKRLNEISAEFMNIRFDMEFVADVYKATLSALEKTRVEASKKIKNLVVIASPNLPDEPEYPRRAYRLSTMFIVLLIVYGIFRLIAATVKEHME